LSACEEESSVGNIPTPSGNPGHPIGIRGVGEVPIVPPPAAIANAIYRATGVRMTELPMSPAKVAKAMLEKNGA